jgi:hypothetical protein
MSMDVDEDEHSIEMHLPFVFKVGTLELLEQLECSVTDGGLRAVAGHEWTQVHGRAHPRWQHQGELGRRVREVSGGACVSPTRLVALTALSAQDLGAVL